MPTEYTVAALLTAGLTAVSTVVGVLWTRLDKYQKRIEDSLDETYKLLKDCEKQKFELLQQKLGIEFKKGG